MNTQSVLQNRAVTGGMSLFSAPGSVLIKTTLVKSLQRRCSQHTDLALVKTSTDNKSLADNATLRRSNFSEPIYALFFFFFFFFFSIILYAEKVHRIHK